MPNSGSMFCTEKSWKSGRNEAHMSSTTVTCRPASLACRAADSTTRLVATPPRTTSLMPSAARTSRSGVPTNGSTQPLSITGSPSIGASLRDDLRLGRVGQHRALLGVGVEAGEPVGAQHVGRVEREAHVHHQPAGGAGGGQHLLRGREHAALGDLGGQRGHPQVRALLAEGDLVVEQQQGGAVRVAGLGHRVSFRIGRVGGGHQADQPPSTYRTWPVRYDDAREASSSRGPVRSDVGIAEPAEHGALGEPAQAVGVVTERRGHPGRVEDAGRQAVDGDSAAAPSSAASARVTLATPAFEA